MAGRAKGKAKEGPEALLAAAIVSSQTDFSCWARTQHVADNSKDLVFQVLSVSSGGSEDTGPYLRLYGPNQQGAAVAVTVTGFLPYFYYPVVPEVTPSHCAVLCEGLQAACPSTRIIQVEVVDRQPILYYRVGADQQRYGRFAKITVGHPRHVTPCSRHLIENGFPGMCPRGHDGYETNIDYELRFLIDRKVSGGSWVVLPAGCYQVLMGANLAATVADLRVSDGGASMHVPVPYELLFSGGSEWVHLADMRVLCMDVTWMLPNKDESPPTPGTKRATQTPAGAAPAKKAKGGKAATSAKENEHDPRSTSQVVSTITCLLTSQHPTSPPSVVVFTHSMQGAEDWAMTQRATVYAYACERDMLRHFRLFVVCYDCDVLTGYDLSDHLALLFERADILGVPEFPYLGRSQSAPAKVSGKQIYQARWVRSQRRMANTSNREFSDIDMEGRIQLDTRISCERERAWRSYSLSDAASELFGATREHLSLGYLSTLHRGHQAQRLLAYGLANGQLALKIYRATCVLENTIELARVTGLTPMDIQTKGQMVRFWSQLCRMAQAEGYVVNAVTTSENSQMTEGPLNLHPTVGYNSHEGVVVLDFKSLYPSIIMAHNLCYTTLLANHDINNVHREEVTAAPYGHFVKASVRRGILPMILDRLLVSRDRVRGQLKSTTDPSLRAVLNGRQLALKICANAAYGFTGASTSKLQCLPIAESTIVYGAQLLALMQATINERYKEGVCNSGPWAHYSCEVIYGDTDSVFVKIRGGCSVEESIAIGQHIAKEMTAICPPPITLQFEKAYLPSLFIERKRYGGLMWTNAGQAGKLDIKGLECVRRDTCGLLIDLMRNVLQLLLGGGSLPTSTLAASEGPARVKAAVAYTRGFIERMFAHKMDMHAFIMTRGLWLGTTEGDYKQAQPHIAVVEKLRARDPMRVVVNGERIQYVYVQEAANARGFEKAEDPQWALDHSLPLDLPHYLDHQLKQPMCRIFHLFTSDPAYGLTSDALDSLFNPSNYARSAPPPPKPTQQPKPGGTQNIAHFFRQQKSAPRGSKEGPKIQARCLSCRALMDGGGPTCSHCTEKQATVYAEQMEAANQNEDMFVRMAAACMRCQGSHFADIVCTNYECPVLYRREHARAHHQHVLRDLARFDDLGW